jgi:CBS domain-containing protein
MHTVSQLMTRDVRTAKTTDVIGPVRDLMLNERIHGVPVIDGSGDLAGIVTSSDLVEEWAPGMGVETVMTADVTTIGPHESVVDAARTMVDQHVHHLVVVEHGQITGMLSSFDVLRHLAGTVEHLVAERTTGVLRAAVGDTIVVRPQAVGGRERRAKVMEVLGEHGSAPFMVRWSDDQHDRPHITMFFPGTDAYVEEAAAAAPR